MTRIIAGSARGRRLAVPPGTRTRPTSDRAREALFSTVESLLRSLRRRAGCSTCTPGPAPSGSRRSAAAPPTCCSSSHDPRAAADDPRQRRPRSGCPAPRCGPSRVERARRHAARPRPPYDVVFLDPPYDLADDDLRAVLAALLDGGWLADGAARRRGAGDPRRRRGSWPAGFDG